MFKIICKELGSGAVLRRVVTQITTDKAEAAGTLLLKQPAWVQNTSDNSMALDGAGMIIILEQAAIKTTRIYKWKAHIMKIVGPERQAIDD